MANAKRELTREALTQQNSKMLLTDAEKFNLELLFQKLQSLGEEQRKIQVALSGFISQVVQARGLDPLNYGVNLAAGRILPVEQQPAPVKIPEGDGEKDKV